MVAILEYRSHAIIRLYILKINIPVDGIIIHNVIYYHYFEKNSYFQSHLTCLIFSLGLEGRKEEYVLFNDALNTFYLWLHGIRHMVKEHSDSERGNLLPPHGLLFLINSKGSFICTIPQTG